jgi:hypothetical protein
MKEQELRACATCGLCHKKIGDSGLPMFYRVRIERYGVKLDAVKRQTGMELLLNGCVPLAQVMGPNEEMTMPLMEPIEFTVCEDCSTDYEHQRHCIARFAETQVPT